MQTQLHSAAFFAAVQRADTNELLNLLHSARLPPEQYRDQRGYTALHVAALNSSVDVVECLFNYVRNNYQDPKQTLHLWVGVTTEEGFTCLHFAAFRGSLVTYIQRMLKLFLAEGADLKARNRQGLNALHIAAQGDQPLILAYLRAEGMDVNEKDYKQGSALHWAAYMGNEMAAAVLLSWNVEKDYPDSDGSTPLHLAAIAGNSRITRNLLLKGANRHVLDLKGRKPLEIATESKLDQLIEMLQEPGFFAECGIKPPVRPYRRSLTTACLYPVGFFVSFILTIVFTVQRNFHSDILYTGMAFYILISLCSFTFYLLTACRDPGYLKQQPEDTLLSLFLRYEAYLVCPDCVVWRPARSRHCQCCDRCVEKFDHHCPWLSNCIGARNLGFFYAFLLSTELSLAVAAVAGFMALLEGKEAVIGMEGLVVKVVGCVIGVGSGLFLLPVTLLFCVQTQNFLGNTTTNERFGSKKKPDDDMSSSTASMYVNRQSRFRNCIGMCCNAPTGELPRKTQVYHNLKDEDMENSRELDTSDVQITH